MFKRVGTGIVMGALAVGMVGMAGGCSSDKPEWYGRERPPVDQLDPRDRGLQSKEVVDASDLLVQKILALPEFNGPERRPVVVTKIENRTTSPYFNYDIFLQRLKTNISQYGRDRVFLVSNRERINRVRSEELETGVGPDTFGQTERRGGVVAVPPTSVQPEWELAGVVTELANRGTSYYHFEFALNNILTRETIPLAYEVRVGR